MAEFAKLREDRGVLNESLRRKAISTVWNHRLSTADAKNLILQLGLDQSADSLYQLDLQANVPKGIN